jgi:hypothetical protein
MFFNELIHQTNIYKIYCISLQKLIKKYNIINWHLNRNVDSTRIENISQTITLTDNTMIPGMICGWINGNNLEIYDGFHRFSACKDYKNMKCIIKIMVCDIDKIIYDFKNINKSISVPFIYTEENSKKKISVCESVVKKLCDKYPHNISSSRSPQRQNFNRDACIDMISLLEIDFDIDNLDLILFTKLECLNSFAKEYVYEM